jgi:hypothetical protein
MNSKQTETKQDQVKQNTRRQNENEFIPHFSLNEQISYHWLFAIEFEAPLKHTALPFSSPIPQEVNN